MNKIINKKNFLTLQGKLDNIWKGWKFLKWIHIIIGWKKENGIHIIMQVSITFKILLPKNFPSKLLWIFKLKRSTMKLIIIFPFPFYIFILFFLIVF